MKGRPPLVLEVGPGPDHVPDPPPVLVPVLGGVSLLDLLARFEGRRGWTPAGGYCGLELAELGPDPLAHYLGRGRGEAGGEGRGWLLGCCCGSAGCWPLDARIDVQPGRVTWDDFVQPHRPERDYSGFGPFVFPRPAYERAVGDALRLISERGT